MDCSSSSSSYNMPNTTNTTNATNTSSTISSTNSYLNNNNTTNNTSNSSSSSSTTSSSNSYTNLLNQNFNYNNNNNDNSNINININNTNTFDQFNNTNLQNYYNFNPSTLSSNTLQSSSSLSSLSASTTTSSSSSSSSSTSSSPSSASENLMAQNNHDILLYHPNTLAHQSQSHQQPKQYSSQNYYQPQINNNQNSYYFNNYNLNSTEANNIYWSAPNSSNTNFENYNLYNNNEYENQYPNQNYYYNTNNTITDYNWQSVNNVNNQTLINPTQPSQLQYNQQSSLSNSPSCLSDYNYQSKAKLENLPNLSSSSSSNLAQSSQTLPLDLNLGESIYESKTKKVKVETDNKCVSKSNIQLYNNTSKKKFIKDEPKNFYLTQMCNVCEKQFQNLSYLNDSTCSDCKTFFKKYARKTIRPPTCNLQHNQYDNLANDCLSCKYDRCLQVGLCLSKLKTKLDDKTENLTNSCSFDETQINNNHINTNLNYLNSNLKQFIMKEIETKKILIRSANTEFKIKEYLTDLTKNIFSFFIKSNNNQLNSITNYINENLKRPILIAYSYLIDHDNDNKSSCLLLLTCDLNQYELRFVNQLSKIYSSYINKSYNETTAPVSSSSKSYENYYNNQDYYNNFNSNSNQFSNQDNQLTNYENYNSSNFFNSFNNSTSNNNHLNELKIFHFLLLLFSSFLNLEQFMQTSSTNNSNTNKNLNSNLITNDLTEIDAIYCQKLILQLIDNVCKDKLIKTKILLSVSDLELF